MRTNCDEDDMDIEMGRRRRRENNFIIVNDVTEETCVDFREDFFRLENSNQAVIPIFIDSYGGDVYALHSMLSLMESSSKKIATICDGKAFSCGAVLLAAGDEKLRFISRHAHMLIHQVSSEYYGKFSDIAVSTEHVAELNTRLLAMLDQFTKSKVGTFERKLKQHNNSDLYLDAKESLRMGLVDHIGIPRLKLTKDGSSLMLYAKSAPTKRK